MHEVLAAHFFWPRMFRDVERLVARCTTCQKAKSRLSNHDLKPYVGEDEELSSRTTSVLEGEDDEGINYNTSTSTLAAPCPAPSDAPSPQVSASSSSGPITRARARDLNFIMLLRNEGPEE
jgi:hypothetical protein